MDASGVLAFPVKGISVEIDYSGGVAIQYTSAFQMVTNLLATDLIRSERFVSLIEAGRVAPRITEPFTVVYLNTMLLPPLEYCRACGPELVRAMVSH